MDDIVLNIDFSLLVGIFILVGVTYFLSIRQAIYAWFDPMFIYFVFNTAAISLVLYLYFKGDIKPFYLYTFLSSIIGFIVGIRLGNVKVSIPVSGLQTADFYKHAVTLDILLFLLTFFLVLSNGILFIVKGTVPILSSNPSDAKVILYEGGWGIVRRWNFIFTSLSTAIIFVKLANPVTKTSRNKKLFLIISLVIVVMVLISTGSKSALVRVITSFFPMYFIHVVLNKYSGSGIALNNYLKYIKKFILWMLIAAVAYMFLVLFLSYGDGNVLTSLLIRLVSAGDAFFYYYVFDLNHYFNKAPVDFITNIFNPLLGMIRLVDYEYPIGAYMISYVYDLPLRAFGPNAQFPIEGLVYFGPYGAWLYAFFLGMIISLVRTRLLKGILKSPGQLNLVIYVLISTLIMSSPTESSLFSTQFIDLFFYGIPLFLASLIIKEALRLDFKQPYHYKVA